MSKDNTTKEALDCPALPQFGPHGGRQFRSPRYFYCGCDAGYCENHAMPRPFGQTYTPGKPRKCRKHLPRKGSR